MDIDILSSEVKTKKYTYGTYVRMSMSLYLKILFEYVHSNLCTYLRMVLIFQMEIQKSYHRSSLSLESLPYKFLKYMSSLRIDTYTYVGTLKM